MQKYMRLILVTGVIAVVGIAHLMATMTFGYEAVAPLHKGDPVIGVAGTAATDELSVGYSQPPKLGVGSVESGAVVSNESLQQPTVSGETQTAPATSAASSLNSSSSTGSSVAMPADFKMPAPSAGIDLSKVRL